MNFARFNHVLVPQSAHARMAWLRSRRGWFLGGSYRLYLALTPLGRAVLLFWFFAGAFGLNVSDTVCYVMWAVVTGLLVTGLMIRGAYRMNEVSVTAHCPKRVCANLPMKIDVTVQSAKHAYDDVRIEAPFLTWDGRYLRTIEGASRVTPQSPVRSRVELRFAARGIHSLMPFTASRTVPFGLTAGTVVESNVVEFVVVPAFPAIEHLTLSLSPRCQPRGIPLASSMGEAMEVGGVRPYRAGDRMRDIHAGTWARVGEPYVRQYLQEYFSRVGVILDVNTVGASEREFEGAVSLCAGILSYLSSREALVDVLCVGNQYHQLTIGRSLGFFEQALDLLASVSPGEALSLEQFQHHLMPQVETLSTVMLICAAVNASNQAVRDWLEACGVPVRVFLVQKAAKPVTEKGYTPILLSQLSQNEALRL